MSRGATAALAIVGSVLLVLAGFSLWFEWAVVNEGRFVDRTSAKLNTTEVQQELAASITDDLLTGFPLLRPLSSNLESTLAGLLAAPQFANVYDQIARTMYQVMTSSQDVSVTIRSDIVTQLVEAAVSGLQGTPLGDFLAQVIQTGLGTTEVVLVDKSDLPPVDSVEPFSPWLALVGGLGGLALLALALLRAADRLAALTVAGVALALGALVVLLLTWLLRDPLTQDSPSAAGRAVTGTAYDAVIGSLRVLNVVLIVVGLALAVVPSIYRSTRARPGEPAAA